LLSVFPTSVVAKAGPGIRFNEHLDQDDGEAMRTGRDG
jgi:hypothetical protein